MIAVPFFSFSLSSLTPHRRPLLFTIVFLFKFKNNRFPSLSPPVFISFALSWGVLFLSFSSFFLFSLSLSLPSAIALSPPVSTSTTLTLQYYQHCQVHFCLHSPRSTSPTLEKRRETARFLTSTDQSSDRLLLGATIILSLRFSTDDESIMYNRFETLSNNNYLWI